MSIRSAASCSQPRQVSSVPRGARTGRAPTELIVSGIMVTGYCRRPAITRLPKRRAPTAVMATRMSSPRWVW